MQERDLSIVGRCPAVVIGRGIPILICVNPSLWDKVIATGTPEFGAAVDGIWTEDDAGSFGDMFAGYYGVIDGFTDGGGYCGIQAKNLLADAIEERH